MKNNCSFRTKCSIVILFNLLENQTPPTINLKETVYKVRENEDVTFTIPFAGTPKPEVEWFTSGTVVRSTPRKKKTLDEDSATLTIKKVVDDDAGEYTIKVTNPVGDVSAALKLIILSKSNRCHVRVKRRM